MNQLLIWYLPIFLIAYLLISFVVPSRRVYKSTGINPMKFGNADTAHDYIGAVMKVLTALLALNILIFAFSRSFYVYLVPIFYLDKPCLKLTGLVLLHLSLGWIILAQYQMNNSWRIGIDETNPTDLVTTGLFGISRNPVFLGMLITIAGVFLLLPNALSFFVLLASYFIIQIQIRLEEAHLQLQHGETYTSYKKSVKRLL